MKETNIFIESLKFAYEKMEQFSYKELMDYLIEAKLFEEHIKPEDNLSEMVMICGFIFGDDFHAHCKDKGFPQVCHWKYPAKGEALSRYVEFIELKEARTAARDANRHAMWAIGIAVVALIAQVVFGLIQFAR